MHELWEGLLLTREEEEEGGGGRGSIAGKRKEPVHLVFGKQEKKCCPLGPSACVATWPVSGSEASAPGGGAAGLDDTAGGGGRGGVPSHSPQITHHPEKSHTISHVAHGTSTLFQLQ